MQRSAGDSPNQRTPLPAGSMDAEEEWVPREMFDPDQSTSLSASNRGVATLPSEYGRERASSAPPEHGPRAGPT